jgi:putative ABC transport system ATP-binding protein
MIKKISSSSIDPVCGMKLEAQAEVESFPFEGKEYFFCGDFCANRFKENPKKFFGTPLVKLVDIKKSFKMGDSETHVLQGLGLYIWEGDFVAIIGSSGSGKSTTLNMIGLLDRPTSGQIFLRDQDISLLSDEERALLRSKTFGFVFQQYNLIPWLTAYENVTLPQIFAHNGFDKEQLMTRFEMVGLKERIVHRPTELSGGEQQRVALLRALANDPKIIIGDEPTGNLDSKTGMVLLDILIDLNKKEGKTLIVVTHDADIAEKADQMIVLKDGQPIQDHKLLKKVYTE